MAKPIPGVQEEIETRVETLDMEMVELEWAGSDSRPILRLRVDFPESALGRGVTVDDCVRVSRALEPWLDEHPEVPERYTLEVSSPGVERPLHRQRDFQRFMGSEVVVKTDRVLEGTRGRRIQGVLERLEDSEQQGGTEKGDEGRGGDRPEGYRVVVRLPTGAEVEVPRDAIVRAHLVYRWDGED